jgi:hypothetical protein
MIVDEYASVCLRTTILNAEKTELTVVTDIMDADGQVVSTKTNKGVINHVLPNSSAAGYAVFLLLYSIHFGTDNNGLWG